MVQVRHFYQVKQVFAWLFTGVKPVNRSKSWANLNAQIMAIAIVIMTNQELIADGGGNSKAKALFISTFVEILAIDLRVLTL